MANELEQIEATNTIQFHAIAITCGWEGNFVEQSFGISIGIKKLGRIKKLEFEVRKTQTPIRPTRKAAKPPNHEFRTHELS